MTAHVAGKKRARSWQDDSTDSETDAAEDDEPAGQLVTRATAEALWPRAARQRSASLTHQVPVLGSLPAEAAKAPVNSVDGTERFSFMPVSDGIAKAVSPFAMSQGQADGAAVLEVNQVSRQLQAQCVGLTEQSCHLLHNCKHGLLF